MFFVYVDFTEDDGRPFYVGKGTATRVKASSRNRYHDRVARKHGMRREVVLATPCEFEALNREIRLIAELHTFVGDPRWNGIGTNFTEGGEGLQGHARSRRTRAKIAASNRGLKRDAAFCKRNKAAQVIAQNRTDVIEKKRATMLSVEMRLRVGSANRDHWARRRAQNVCERCGQLGHYRSFCKTSLFDVLATRWEKEHPTAESRQA